MPAPKQGYGVTLSELADVKLEHLVPYTSLFQCVHVPVILNSLGSKGLGLAGSIMCTAFASIMFHRIYPGVVFGLVRSACSSVYPCPYLQCRKASSTCKLKKQVLNMCRLQLMS